MTRARLIACAALTLAFAGCSDELPLTEIVLAVDSDISAIETVRIKLENFGDGEDIDVPIGSVDEFPRSLSLVHDGGPLGPIHVTVSGLDANDDPLIVEPRREIHFKKDQTLLLRVELWQACLGLCDADSEMPACVLDDNGEPSCVSAEDAADAGLSEWNGSLDGPNAAMDGGAALDGTLPDVDGTVVMKDAGAGDSTVPMVDAGPDRDANAPLGEFPYTPSNFVPLADGGIGDLERRDISFDCSGEVIYNSDDDSFSDGCVDPRPVSTTVVQSDSSEARLLVFETLTVATGTTLRMEGSLPVILAVFGDAAIAGNLDASAVGAAPGAGGNANCSVGAGQVGQVGSNSGLGSADTGEGGGGGGFGSSGARGGEGGGGTPEQGAGGNLEGTSTLIPLRGGCPGGKGGDSTDDDVGGAGGGGGGALQISAAGALDITGSLSAAGGGGRGGGGREAGGGGGGSGGALLLEAETLSIDANATFALNGGGGGAGHDQGNNSTAAAAGSDGARNAATQASGGVGANGAGSGGNGAAAPGSATTGGNGNQRSSAVIVTPGDGGGGGGGGVGRIRMRGASSCETPPGIYSPIAGVECAGCKCGAPPTPYCTRASTPTRGYYLCTSALGWNAARTSCQGAGMDLAHVNDAAENTHIDTAADGQTDVWLGGTDTSENIWRWIDDDAQFWSGDASGGATESDGSACTLGEAGCSFSDWGTSGTNQPDNADPGGGEGDCLSLVPSDGWYDANCTASKAYVCEAL